ncbi:hypothetical protein ACFSVM_25610 [Paenibacillus shunpengii]|uniref:Phage gp6-like head-tail connector protein n=1 Tax=Paenibacillus shunpengii TaxID=2054424 RepID=A0ABW5SVV1_9BACL
MNIENVELFVKLKGMMGIPLDDTSKDAQLEFSLELTIDIVKTYCNITEIPDGLKLTVVRIAKDYYISEYTDTAAVNAAVKSLKFGDMTANLEESNEGVEGTSIVNNYKSQLNAYRKLRW